MLSPGAIFKISVEPGNLKVQIAGVNPQAQKLIRTLFFFSLFTFGLCLPDTLRAQDEPKAAASNAAPNILFVGNSFMYGAGSPVQSYRPETVTDLNGTKMGGVPALFKAFAAEAGCDFAVSLETAPGMNLDYHLQSKADVIGRSWDYAVLQGYSTLDSKKPGDPTVLVESAKGLAELLRSKNAKVDVRLVATWSRADQTYPESGHWHGQPIEKMALDVRHGYDLATAAGAPTIRDVIPVGEAWNRAMQTGVADPNPYDGLAPAQLNLWGKDNYHASSYGYYLEALMIFGDLTGLDPRSLGQQERVAVELGFTPGQTAALQQVAFDELTVTKGRLPLQPFKPVSDNSPPSKKRRIITPNFIK